MNAPASTAVGKTGYWGCCTIHTANGNVAAALMEPSEIWRDHATTPAKTTSTQTIASGVRHKNAPIKLATALPPRNRRNTGYACPAITASAAADIHIALPPLSRPA